MSTYEFGERIDMGSTEECAWVLQREVLELSEVVRFVMDGEPVSKSRARFTGAQSKYRAYTPEKTRAAEERVAWLARQAGVTGVPDAEHCFGVFAKFFSGTWHRRDVDNMLKLVCDALTGVVWKDDSQVSEVSGAMQRGVSDPRTHVLIYRTMAPVAPTKPCGYCGKPVRQYQSLMAKFCSRACGDSWRRERRQHTCGHCGVTFESKSSEAKYCSSECAYVAKHVSVTCVRCGVAFTKARSLVRYGNSYCSPECKATYWREQRKSAAKGTCADCGGPTTKKSYMRCRTCLYAAGGRHAS